MEDIGLHIFVYDILDFDYELRFSLPYYTDKIIVFYIFLLFCHG